MKRVAIFGNAAGGKSTLARELAAITGLPRHTLDKIRWREGGVEVPYDEYVEAHAKLVEGECWIIDGYGCPKTLWPRLEAADTLVHVDLPLALHALWVTKRFAQGLFADPEGWPRGSPLVASTLSSYRVLWPCHKYLTPKYRAFAADAVSRKRVFHLRSTRDIRQWLEAIRSEAARP